MVQCCASSRAATEGPVRASCTRQQCYGSPLYIHAIPVTYTVHIACFLMQCLCLSMEQLRAI